MDHLTHEISVQTDAAQRLRGFRWILVIAVAALLAKVVLAFNTLGSTDVLTWRSDVEKLRCAGVERLYQEGVTYQLPERNLEQPFIHPPLVIHLLQLWSWAESITSLPLQFWMRVSCALADFVVVLILLRQYGPLFAVGILAISPVSLLISGYHGNTDPIMICMVLVSVYCIESRRPVWISAVFFAVAVSVKLAAVIFAPAILLALGSRRLQLVFLSVMAVVAGLVATPYLFVNPLLITRSVLSYSSYSGTWGISRLLYAMLGDAEPITMCYTRYGKWLFAAAIVGATLWLRHRGRPLLLQCAVSSLLFLFLSPGFGVQYLAWALPWITALPPRSPILYNVSAGVFLFAYYNRSAGGMPWYLSDSIHFPPYYGWVIYSGLFCWIAIGFALTQIGPKRAIAF